MAVYEQRHPLIQHKMGLLRANSTGTRQCRELVAEIARSHAESEFEKYRIVQDRLFESDFDRLVAESGLLEGNTPGTMSNEGEEEP